jgi:uncharacterized protein DUF5908
MALEVSEIGIQMRVCGAGEAGGTQDPAPATGAEGLDREAIVDDCVRRVLQVLRRREER